jgi:hypothetical protein
MLHVGMPHKNGPSSLSIARAKGSARFLVREPDGAPIPVRTLNTPYPFEVLRFRRRPLWVAHEGESGLSHYCPNFPPRMPRIVCCTLRT